MKFHPWHLIVVLTLGMGSVVFFATAQEGGGEDESKSFTEFVQELYYTVVDYELVEEDEEGEWENKDKSGFEYNQKEFEKLMKCIFIQAEDESRYYFADLAKKKLEGLADLKPLPDWEWPEELEEPETPEGCMKLDEIFDKQEEHGFKTMCDPDEHKNPLVGEVWHYCKITEMVLNELWAKEEVDLFTSDQARSRDIPNFAFNQEAVKPLEDALKKELTQFEEPKLRKYWREDIYDYAMAWNRESVLHALEQYRRNFRHWLYQTKLTYDTEWAKGVFCRYEMIRCWSWDGAFGPQDEPEGQMTRVQLEQEKDVRIGRFYNPVKDLSEESCGPEGQEKKCEVADFCKE